MYTHGGQIDAAEALRLGLVARVFPPAETVDAAVKTAAKMASFSLPHLMMAKEAVNQAYEVGLQQGLQGELRAFWGTFATDDQKEGMSAFAEKRKPSFTNK